ncbi:unnamed protein product [Rotaria socialis]
MNEQRKTRKIFTSKKFPNKQVRTKKVVEVEDEQCGITFNKIKTDSLSSCIFTIIFGELSAKPIAYLSHCSLTYQPRLFTPTTTAAAFIKEIENDMLDLFNEKYAANPIEKPNLTQLQNLKMVIGAGGKVKPDLIRKGLALLNSPKNNINQHLKTEGALHLYCQLQNNVKIMEPITFIMNDDDEDLGAEGENVVDPPGIKLLFDCYTKNLNNAYLLTVPVQEICNHDLNDQLSSAGEKLVVVICFATDCTASKSIAPYIEYLNAKYLNAVFLKADIGKRMNEFIMYSIAVTPTFLFFQHGEQVARLQSANKESIEEIILKFYKDAPLDYIEYMNLKPFIEEKGCMALNTIDAWQNAIFGNKKDSLRSNADSSEVEIC